MKFYIEDDTLKPNEIKFFNSYDEVVKYLNDYVGRKYNYTRKQYMDYMESIGHGYDDRDSVNFIRLNSLSTNIGIVREGRCVRCDITAINSFQKDEFGS